MITHGRRVRPWLGISGLTVTREVTFYHGSPIDRGVLITRVIPGSHANNTGIASSDMVLEFAGKTTNNIEGPVKTIRKKEGQKSGNINSLKL